MVLKTQSELDEIARQATEIYERRIEPTLPSEDDGKFVAVDVHTEEFEIDPDDYTAVMKLRERLPTAEIWLFCAGQPATYRMGRRK